MKNNSIKRRFSLLFFLTFLLSLLSPGTSHSNPDLPDDSLVYPVLLMSKEGTGSGFFYNKGDTTYLITARHVLFQETSVRVPEHFFIPKALIHKFYYEEDKGKKEFLLKFYGVMSESERDELIKTVQVSNQVNFNKAIKQLYEKSQKLELISEEITLFSVVPKRFGGIGVNEIEVKLTNLFKSGDVKYHPSQDIAFVKIGVFSKVEGQKDEIVKFKEGITSKRGEGFLGLEKDNFKLLKDVIVGNPAFVFGYPTSITKIDPWLDIKLPLLRKGIIAGKNESLSAIILDCPIFYGNSGGLVIEVEKTSLTETKYKAIGVITNFVPYDIKWFQNSGYSIVVPMDFVEELIAGQTN
jgi:hypothetical protein